MSTLPPGPRSAALAPLQYMRDPIGCLLPYARRYGPTYTLPGKDPLVVAGEPGAIRDVYTAEPDALEPFDRSQTIFLGEHSMILQGGATHRRQRRLLGPPFLPSRVNVYGPRVVARAEARLEGWAEGRTLSALELGQQVALDVILQAVFGVVEPARMEALSRALRELLDAFSPLLFLFEGLRHDFGGLGPFARFQRRRAALHAAFDELIAEARAAGPREDVLSLILAARDEEGAPLTEAEIRDQLLLLVIAGHETTAIAIAWALYALHREENAAALERLRAELDEADPGPEATAALPWLGAVCQETLRRFPLAPAPAARRLLRPLRVGEWELPAGLGVVVGIGVVHFDEAIYPDPWAFRPERFLERSFSPFEYVPFGGGARRCLGAPLAMLEMKLVLATTLRRLRLRLASQRPDGGRVRGANAGPASGVPLVVLERRA